MFKKLVLMGLMMSFINLNGQDSEIKTPNIVPPSPDVSALLSFQEENVNQSTGHAQISLPVLNKNVYQDLSLNIALNYNTSLVKVINKSGWNGVGWSGNMFYSISRTIKGYPDEYVKGLEKITGILNLEEYWIYDQLNSTERRRFLWKSAGDNADKYDYNQDVFNFNSLGISGSFILNKKYNSQGDEVIEALPLEMSNNILKINIDFDYQTRTINCFNIKDTQNRVHYFTAKERSSTGVLTGTTTYEAGGVPFITGSDSEYWYDSAWFLEKIEFIDSTGNREELITIEYQNLFKSYLSNISRSYTYPTSFDDEMFIQTNIANDPYNYNVMDPKEVVSYNSTMSDNLSPLRINFRDGTYIDFTQQNKLLHRIEYKQNNGTLINKWQFEYYTNSYGRPFLTKMRKGDSLTEEEFSLEYKNKEIFPEPLNPSTDEWGYYRRPEPGIYQNEREDMSYRFTGFLTKVIRPTGGYSKFIYEPTHYSYDVNGLIPIEETKKTNQLNWLPRRQDYNLNTDGSNSIVINNSSEEEYIFEQLNNNVPSNYLINMSLRFTLPDNSIITIPCDEDFRTITLPAGSTTLQIFSLDSPPPNYQYNFRLNFRDYVLNPVQYLHAGGGVVSKIQLYDYTDELKKEIAYDYLETNTVSNKISSGAIDGLFSQITRDYVMGHTYFFKEFNCSQPTEKLILLNHKSNTISLNGIGQNNVSYSLAKQSLINYQSSLPNTNNQDTGHIETIFTSAREYHNDQSVYQYPFSVPIDYNYKIGLPKMIKTYDNQGNLLTQENFIHAFETNALAKNRELKTFVNPWKRFFIDWTAMINMNGVPDQPMMKCEAPCNMDCFDDYIEPLGIHYFDENDIVQTNVQTTSISKIEYFPSQQGNIISTSEHNQYHNFLYLPTETKNETSLNEEIIVKTYYSQDINSIPTGVFSNEENQVILNMVHNANMVTTPILKESYKDGELIGRVKYSYYEFLPEMYLPSEVAVSKRDDPFETRLEYVSYDEYGNILEVKKSDGTPVSYIWGYNKTLPIAKIEGMTRSQVLGQIGVSSPDETHLSQINSLRDSFSVEDPFMLTTYEYEVGIGIKSVTDPRGRVMTYHYDEFNRLKYVKDQEGNILSENEYKYATQL